jgi:glycerol-3-phosphate dehydrogenase
MNVSLAMTAALYGSTVVNHIEVIGLEKDASGRLCGARVKDLVMEKDGKKADGFVIRAKGVINATGPFTDSIRKMEDETVSEIVAPSAGVHVMLPGYYSPQKMVMSMIAYCRTLLTVTRVSSIHLLPTEE